MAEIPTSSNPSDDLETQKLNGNEEDYDHHHDEDPESDDENYEYALQIAEMLPFPMVMKTAIELDLLGIIATAGPDRQLSAAEIAAALPAAGNPDAPAMLDRMLYLLATYSVVTCTAVDGGASGGVVRKYGLAPVAKYFVSNEDGVSLGALISLNQGQAFLASWSKLKEAALEGGIPFNKVHGMDVFHYQGTEPRFNKIFNKAMYGQSTYIIKKIVRRYKGFENIQRLVDVGGGLGHTLRVITSNYPSIKGINFDLPHVIQHAPTIPGVEHVGGDMFESIPNGDAIFMKCILHDWSDEHCLKTLKNCYKALPRKGKVIVVQMNMIEEPQTTPLAKAISQLDVCLMTQSPGGKERTRREFQTLAEAAGFAEFNPVCHVAGFWVMEFLK
uniref:O-methyltransferase 10 n=1 Tax=Lophophora williamsii TaxID=130138 RepID=A0AAU7BB35_LOPWI